MRQVKIRIKPFGRLGGVLVELVNPETSKAVFCLVVDPPQVRPSNPMVSDLSQHYAAKREVRQWCRDNNAVIV